MAIIIKKKPTPSPLPAPAVQRNPEARPQITMKVKQRDFQLPSIEARMNYTEEERRVMIAAHRPVKSAQHLIPVECKKCGAMYVYPCHGQSNGCMNKQFIDGTLPVEAPKPKIVLPKMKLKIRSKPGG